MSWAEFVEAALHLFAAVGSLAQVAGWADVDAGDHEASLPCFGLALHCAEQASDWTLL